MDICLFFYRIFIRPATEKTQCCITRLQTTGFHKHFSGERNQTVQREI